MDYAVIGIKQMEFDALERNGFIGIDKQSHVAATGDPFLN